MRDIIVISFSSLANDGRAANLINTLSSKFNVASVSFKSSQTINDCEGNNYYIEDKKGRAWERWLSFTKNITKIDKELDAKIYLASDLYSLPAASYLSKKYKGKYIYDSREIYSALGPLANNPIKQFAITKIEKFFVKDVNNFIVSGDLDAEELRRHFDTNKEFWTIMNLPFYTEPVNSNLIKERFPYLENKTILLYQGAVLPGRGIIPAMKALQRDESLGLAILGDGFFMGDAKYFAKKNDLLERVAFCGNVDYSTLHEWTCSADIGMNLIEPISQSYRLALPNKMFEYIMAGIPQLATDLPAMKQIMNKYNVGELVPESLDTDSIIYAIKKIQFNKMPLAKNCLSAAKSLNYNKQSEKIIKMFEQVIRQ